MYISDGANTIANSNISTTFNKSGILNYAKIIHVTDVTKLYYIFMKTNQAVTAQSGNSYVFIEQL